MVAPDALISIFGAPSCTVATATDREGGAWTGSVPAPASRPPGAGPEQVGVVHSTRTTAGPRSGPESQPSWSGVLARAARRLHDNCVQACTARRQDRRRLEAAIAFAGWPTAHDNRLQDAGDFVSTLEAVVHLQQATKKTKPIHSGCDSRG